MRAIHTSVDDCDSNASRGHGGCREIPVRYERPRLNRSDRLQCPLRVERRIVRSSQRCVPDAIRLNVLDGGLLRELLRETGRHVLQQERIATRQWHTVDGAEYSSAVRSRLQANY